MTHLSEEGTFITRIELRTQSFVGVKCGISALWFYTTTRACSLPGLKPWSTLHSNWSVTHSSQETGFQPRESNPGLGEEITLVESCSRCLGTIIHHHPSSSIIIFRHILQFIEYIITVIYIIYIIYTHNT